MVLHGLLVEGKLVSVLILQRLILIPWLGGHDRPLEDLVDLISEAVEDALHNMVRSGNGEKEDILQTDQRKG